MAKSKGTKKLHGAAAAAHQRKLDRAKRQRAALGTSPKKKGTTVAKKAKKRKTSGGGKRRGGGGRRRGGSAGGGLSKREVYIALGSAAAYGYISNRAAEGTADDMKWFKEAPVITPVGRAGTAAIAAYALYKMKVLPKYMKPIAYGLGAVALLNLGRRGFKPYATESEARALMAAGPEDDSQYLEGDLDLDGEDVDDVGGDPTSARDYVGGEDGVIDINEAA